MASSDTECDSTGKSSGRRCCRSRMRRDLFATSSRRSAGICRKATQSSSSMKLWTRFANGIHFNRCFFFRPVFVVFSDLLRQWSHMYEVNWRETHPLGGGIVTKYVPLARGFRNWLSDTCQDPKLVTTSRDLFVLQSSCHFDQVVSCLQTHRLLLYPMEKLTSKSNLSGLYVFFLYFDGSVVYE
jgi:hypothetical protein